jgi:hypothetical protein
MLSELHAERENHVCFMGKMWLFCTPLSALSLDTQFCLLMNLFICGLFRDSEAQSAVVVL